MTLKELYTMLPKYKNNEILTWSKQLVGYLLVFVQSYYLIILFGDGKESGRENRISLPDAPGSLKGVRWMIRRFPYPE